MFDFRIRRQQRINYKGCHFNKIVAESCDDQEVFDLVRAHKDRLWRYIHDLVGQTGHRKLLGDDALTDSIFILLEGGMALGAMYRSPDWTEKAKVIVTSFL